LRDRIIEDGDIENPSPTRRWNVKRDQFLKKFKRLSRKISGFTKVPIEKYTELKDDYEAALQDALDIKEQLDEANKTIKKLKIIKNKKAVTEILLENKDEWEQFEALAKDAKSSLDRLTNIAVEAFVLRTILEGLIALHIGNKDWLREEVRKCKKEVIFMEQKMMI